MAGIAIVLDLVKRGNPKGFYPHTLHSFGTLSAASAASAAAALAASRPSVSRFLFGDGGFPIAYCDAAAVQSEDYFPFTPSGSEDITHRDSVQYGTKQYPTELKPLLSAFGLRSFAMTSLRSFLLFYLPLLEPRSLEDEDDFPEDAPEDRPEDRPVDLVVPFENSVKQIIRETTVITTRRVLERVAAHYCSQRVVWKLLKDVPRSARRKAERQLPTMTFCFRVGRTTFRGQLLGVVASWIIQVGIEVYRCFFRKSSNNDLEAETSEKFKIFGKKMYSTTVKCSASLIFASVGAGIGALANPSVGQWVGSALGDFAGPIIAIICFEKLGMNLCCS